MSLGTWAITIGGSAFCTTAQIVDIDSVQGGPNITAFAGYGAAAPVFLNLGNAKIQRVFTITQEWTTDTLAEAYRQTAIATWAGVATVVISHTDYAAATTNWTITNAKVELAVPQRIGPTTITKLTITGGS